MRKRKEKERKEERKMRWKNERGTNIKKVGIWWDKEGKEGKKGRKRKTNKEGERGKTDREREREKMRICLAFRRSKIDGPRRKVDPRIAGYAWVPKSWIFVKLREVENYLI